MALMVEAIMQRGGLLHKLSVVDDKGHASLLGTFLDDGTGPPSKTIVNHLVCKNEYERDLAAVRQGDKFTLVAYSKEKEYKRANDFIAYLRGRHKAAKVVISNLGTLGFLFPDAPATPEGVPCIQCYYDTGKRVTATATAAAASAGAAPSSTGAAAAAAAGAAGSRKRPAPGAEGAAAGAAGAAAGAGAGAPSPTGAATAAAKRAKQAGASRFQYLAPDPLPKAAAAPTAGNGNGGAGEAGEDGPAYTIATGGASAAAEEDERLPPPPLLDPSQFPRSKDPRFRYLPPTPLPGQAVPPFYDDPEKCPAAAPGLGAGQSLPSGELAALLLAEGNSSGAAASAAAAAAAAAAASSAAASGGAWGKDQQVAAGFYNTLRRDFGSRNQSLVFHLRKLNNWVKSLLINGLRPAEAAGRELEVLDLACGKGGDFTKWRDLARRFPVARYVGVDIAKASLVDAIGRYQGSKDIRASLGSALTLGCADLGATDLCNDDIEVWEATEDAWGSRPLLDEGDHFDAITMQFALHYMFEDEARARRFFQAVGRHLRPGGTFIATTVDARVVVELLAGLGKEDPATGACVASLKDEEGRELCRLQVDAETYGRLFRPVGVGQAEEEGEPEGAESQDTSFCGLRYTFLLRDGSEEDGAADAVNAPEWLIPLPRLVALAGECGLALETAQNFHELVQANRDKVDGGHDRGAGGRGGIKWLNWQGSISPAEWAIARIYIALRFRRV